MKKIRIILIVLIVINSISFLYLLFTNKAEEYTYESYATMQRDIAKRNGELNQDNEIKPVRDSIISFENEIILLGNYTGALTTGAVNVKFTDLLDGGFAKLYEDTKGMDLQSLENYLNANIFDIELQTGISNIDDFEKFIQKIQIYKDKNIQCTKAEIIENSYESGDDYDTFKVQLNYDNGQTAVFYVSLRNALYMDSPQVIIK